MGVQIRIFLRLVYISILYLYHLTEGYYFEVTCHDGWRLNRYTGTCQKLFQQYKSWDDARTVCQRHGGDLVKIVSDPMNRNTLGAFSPASSPYYIGLKRENYRQGFRWLDETREAYYQNWHRDEPDNNGRVCGVAEKTGDFELWADVSCSDKLHFLCEKSEGVICLPEWTPSADSGTCIRLYHAKETWTVARAICQAVGGDLLTIGNTPENRFIRDQVKRYGYPFWIGFKYRKQEGKFQWLDYADKVRYTNWHSGEPNNGGNVYCAQVNGHGIPERYWSAAPCDSASEFICERFPDCTVPFHGKTCPKTCSVHCAGPGNECNKKTGVCKHGCERGFQGPLCDTACTNASAGSKEKGCRCSPNCGGEHKSCDPRTGRCHSGCAAGYKGETCDTGCSAGRWGDGCSKTCSTRCAGPTRDCNPVNGDCTSGTCVVGYQGSACDRVCDAGTFGIGCSHNCSSTCIGSFCNEIHGHCKKGCVEGFLGDFCDIGCVNMTYGLDCSQSCSPHCVNKSCDTVNGSCADGCEPGYYGYRCDLEIYGRPWLMVFTSLSSVLLFICLVLLLSCTTNTDEPYGESVGTERSAARTSFATSPTSPTPSQYSGEASSGTGLSMDFYQSKTTLQSAVPSFNSLLTFEREDGAWGPGMT